MDNNKKSSKTKKSYLFDFQAFIANLRNNEKGKKTIENYEAVVLKGHQIRGDIKEQKWYTEYISKIIPVKYVVPDEINEYFDWDILLQLVAGSFSSTYKFGKNPDGLLLPDLLVTVKSGEQSITKRIGELWSFQVQRLFEIYCEEQINLECLRYGDSIEKEAIDNEREERKEFYSLLLANEFDESLEEGKNEDPIHYLSYKDKDNHIIKPGSDEVHKKKKTKTKKNHLVYHYTSLNSAYQILKNGTVFMSDIRYMNDRDELTFGTRVLKVALDEIIDSKKEEKKIIEENYLQWLEAQKQSLNNSNIELDNFAFIGCFSTKSDDLNQWRAYASNGTGVCIGFDREMLEKIVESQGCLLRNVDYIDLEKKNSNKHEKKIWESAVEDLDKLLYDYYEQEVKEVNGSSISINNTDTQLATLFDKHPDISNLIRFYKNSAFKEESEVRVVKTIHLKNNEIDKIETRVDNDKKYIIPYIKVKLNDEKNDVAAISPIKEIMIGPSLDDVEFEKSKQSFDLFLQKNGYDWNDKMVSHSRIPYVP